MQTNLLFYNVENLFDTLDDPHSNDNAFLPDSSMEWHQKRYVLKLQRIARVLKAVEEPLPGLVGLAEVESRKVLEDLLVALELTENEVGIIHADSEDERGMDVALLYRKDCMKLIHTEQLQIRFPSDPEDRTRDILYAQIEFLGEAFHLYVNHWPSRKDGTMVSQVKRFDAANVLKTHLDQLKSRLVSAKVLLMGDLNCTPDSPPVYRVLDQKGHPENKLVNLGWDIHLAQSGSTNFKGKWLLFDQMLCTPEFLDSDQIRLDNFEVVSFPWMLFYNQKYKDFRPNKTYGGRNYHGGFSDHLPVKVTLY